MNMIVPFGIYTYSMIREEYEYFEAGRRDREKEKPKFTDLLMETLKKVEDIIMAGKGSSLVDLDKLIDILSDPQQSEQSLQLHAIKAIRETRREVELEQLITLIKSKVQSFPIKQNMNRWATSFKRIHKDSIKYFEVNKLKKYMQGAAIQVRLTNKQQSTFKDRDAWTYKELFSACSHPQ